MDGGHHWEGILGATVELNEGLAGRWTVHVHGATVSGAAPFRPPRQVLLRTQAVTTVAYDRRVMLARRACISSPTSALFIHSARRSWSAAGNVPCWSPAKRRPLITVV